MLRSPQACRLTVGQAVARLCRRLARAGVPTPEVDAEWLARHATGWSRATLLARQREPLAAEVGERLERLGERRAGREPLQLILGSVGFRYLDLLVRPGVFIPRPETETLAGEAIARLPDGGVAVEPCTGAGAVACALAQEAAASVIVATDASDAAVGLARENAARNGVDVAVRCGDLLAPVDRELAGAVDVLVANPPYVADHELAATEPEVRDWDPSEALVAGSTGHEIVDRLIAAAPGWLRPGGWLLVEVDERRAPETARRCTTAGLEESMVVCDLSGRARVVLARQPSPHPAPKGRRQG